jgi:metal-sulfur cluster biosynthetic enzyme
MAEPVEDAIRAALDEVIDPCSEANGTDLSVVEMGLVDRVAVDDGSAVVRLRLTSPHCTMLPYFEEEIERRVGALTGVDSVTVEADDGLQWGPELMSDEARERRAARRRRLAESAAERRADAGAE